MERFLRRCVPCARYHRGVSEASAAQKQMSESLQVQVDPVSDAGLAAAKETTAHTATTAAVRQDVVETRCGVAFPMEWMCVATYLLNAGSINACRCGVANKSRII